MVGRDRYTLTSRTYSMLRGRYGDDYACDTCGHIFKEEETVVRKQVGKGGRMKWRCVPCAKEKNII